MSALASPWVVDGGGSDVAAPVGGEADIEAAACCVIISLAAAAAAAAAVAVVEPGFAGSVLRLLFVWSFWCSSLICTPWR